MLNKIVHKFKSKGGIVFLLSILLLAALVAVLFEHSFVYEISNSDDLASDYIFLQSDEVYSQRITFIDGKYLSSFDLIFDVLSSGYDGSIDVSLVCNQATVQSWTLNLENMRGNSLSFKLDEAILIDRSNEYSLLIISHCSDEAPLGLGVFDSNAVYTRSSYYFEAERNSFRPFVYLMILTLMVVSCVLVDESKITVKKSIASLGLIAFVICVFYYSIIARLKVISLFPSINETEYSINFITMKMAYICFFIVICSAVIFFGKDFAKKKPQEIFLVVAIPLTTIYMVLFTPWNLPDAHSHFQAAYRFSNYILGVDSSKEWYGRQSDVQFFSDVWDIDSNRCSSEAYYSLYSNASEGVDSSLSEFHIQSDFMKYYSVVGYLPAVLGLVIGRLLNLSTVNLLLLCRIIMIAVYVAFMYRAIARIPIGKYAMMFISLFPISIMMSSAFSYDLMVMISTMNFIASIFYVYKNPTSRMGFAEALVWIAIVGATKGGGYMILLPLIFMLYSREDKRSSSKVLTLALSGILSMYIFDGLLQIGKAGLFQLGSRHSYFLSASYFFEHPVKVILMTIDSFISGFDAIVGGGVGAYLGWYEYSLPNVLMTFLLIICVCSSYFEKDALSLVKRDEIILVVCNLLCLICVPIMLLSYTFIYSNQIEGIQGRYFLPVLPLLIMILTKFNKNRLITLSDESRVIIQTKLVNAFVDISFIAIFIITRLYLTR